MSPTVGYAAGGGSSVPPAGAALSKASGADGDVAWQYATAAGFPERIHVAGGWYDSRVYGASQTAMWSATTSSTFTSQVWYMPFFCPTPVAINAVAAYATSWTPAHRVGLHAGTGGPPAEWAPGALMAQGSFTGTGYQTLTFPSVTLPAGMNYVTVAAGATALDLLCALGGQQSLGGNVGSNNNWGTQFQLLYANQSTGMTSYPAVSGYLVGSGLPLVFYRCG